MTYKESEQLEVSAEKNDGVTQSTNPNPDDNDSQLWLMEISGTFIFAILLAILGFLLSFFLRNIAEWILGGWLLISAFLLFFTYPASRCNWFKNKNRFKKILYYYGDFGRRLWSFDGLWLVVFLVGCYVTATNAAKEIIPAGVPYLDDLNTWLSAIRDLVLSTFLAVVTAVISNTFGHMSDASNKIEGAKRHIDRAHGEIEKLAKTLIRTQDTVKILADAYRNTQRRTGIISVAGEIESQNSTIRPYSSSIRKMSEAIEQHNDRVLFPLLLPGELPPLLPEDPDTIAKISQSMRNPEHQSHYSYMSAVIARSLKTESDERCFPGVVIEYTSFAYYVRTVQEIVESLRPWWDEYDFYTIMPESPANLFRFSNSVDFDEWKNFLKYYYEYQKDTNGNNKNRIWCRNFAYYLSPETKEKYKNNDKLNLECIKALKYELCQGYVIVDKNDCGLPAKLNNNEIDIILKNITDCREREEAAASNKTHDGYGTFVTLSQREPGEKFPSHLSGKIKWEKLEDLLVKLHGGNNRIGTNLKFRSMDSIVHTAKQEVNIQSYNACYAPGNTARSINMSFDLPIDLFAVCKKNEESLKKWKLLIGRDPITSQGGGANTKIAFTVSINLDTMAESTSKRNKDSSANLRQYLEELFIVGADGSKPQTLSELKQ